MAKENKSPVKTISIMMIITLLGKISGLLRDRLLTINSGTGMEANAFLTASRIPRVFFDAVFASAITASFLPVFNEYMMRNGKKAGNDRHFDTKGEVYPLVGNEKSAFFCFPLPTPYPFGLPADYQPKRQ